MSLGESTSEFAEKPSTTDSVSCTIMGRALADPTPAHSWATSRLRKRGRVRVPKSAESALWSRIPELHKTVSSRRAT
jgi:hypothetical protein